MPQEWDKTGLTNEQRLQYNREVSDILASVGFNHISLEAEYGQD